MNKISLFIPIHNKKSRSDKTYKRKKQYKTKMKKLYELFFVRHHNNLKIKD